MSTTIDNIAIKISSSSKSASRSIDTACKSLQRLYDQVNKMSATDSAINKIARLSGMLQKLGNVKTDGIRASASALRALADVSKVTIPDDLGQKISGIAEGLKPLENVKVDGSIARTINSLAKISGIADGLNDEKIEKFGVAVSKVSNQLAPLATRTTKAASGVSKMGKAADDSTSSMNRLQATMEKIQRYASLSGFESALNIARRISDSLASVTNEAIEWEGISQRFARGFGSSAESTIEWVDKITDTFGTNQQQLMQYASIYAVMLKGFGVASQDAQTMAKGYTELAYDIWAGYNDIYSSYEETAQAIQSAITGQVKSVRRAGFDITQATLEETAANHGLEISIANATQAEKSYLRYLTLVDQAASQNLIGEYAREMNTVEGVTRTLAQETKTLAQALGSLFMPLLKKLIPVATAIVELVTDMVKYIASLFGITIQTIDWDWNGFAGAGDALEDTLEGMDDAAGGVADSMGDAAGAAAEYKKTILGIDEINPLNAQNSGSGGGSGGSGGSGGAGGSSDSGLNWDVGSLWTDAIFDSVSKNVDEIKAKISEVLPIVEAVAGAFALWVLPTPLALGLEGIIEFHLSTQWLEDGNWLALICEALLAAGGSAILYAKMGASGIALGIGVAVIAQAVAIGFEMASGNIAIDDPKLWIQSLMTTAIGTVGGGIFLTKVGGTFGEGAAIGAAVSVALIATAITFGSAVQGDITTTILSGIATVVSSALSGYLIGKAVIGAAAGGGAIGVSIGLVAGLVLAGVSVVSGLKEKEKQELEAQMQKEFGERLGDIELDNVQVKAWVDEVRLKPGKVTMDGQELTMDEAVNLKAKLKVDLDNSKAEFESTISEMNTVVGALSLGVDIDQEDALSKVNSFVSAAQDLLDKEHLETKLSLSMLGMENSDLSKYEQEAYAQNKEQVELLQSQLQQLIGEGKLVNPITGIEFVVPESERSSAIAGLEKQIADIVLEAAKKHYEASIETLEITYGGKLSIESRKKFIDEFHSQTQEMMSALGDSITVDMGLAIQMRDDTGDTDAFEKAKKELQDKYFSKIVPYISDEASAVTEQINAVMDTTIEDVFDNLGMAVRKYSKAGLDGLPLAGYTEFATQVGKALSDGLDQTSETVKESAASLWESVKPSADQARDAANQARYIGENVPREISNALNEEMKLGYLAGDAEALDYMIGYELTQSKAFIQMITTTKDAFAEVPQAGVEGIANNINVLRDEITGQIIGIQDLTTDKITNNLTPTMLSNLAALGIDVSNAVAVDGEMLNQKTQSVLNSFNATARNSMSNIYGDLTSKASEVGDGTVESLITEFMLGNPQAVAAIDSLGQETKKALENAGLDLKGAGINVGTGVTESITSSIDSGKPQVYNMASDSIAEIRAGYEAQQTAVSQAGSNVVTTSTTAMVSAGTSSVALAQLKAIPDKQALTINSEYLTAFKISGGVSGLTKGHGQAVALGLKNGISDSSALSSIKGAATSIGNAANTSLTTSLKEGGQYKSYTVGKGYGNAVSSAMKETQYSTSLAAKGIATAAANSVSAGYSGMYDAGYYIAQGVMRGIQGYGYFFELRNWINGLLTTTKRLANIGSPSRLFADEVGYWLAAGVAEGMDEPDILIKPMSAMLDETTEWWDKNAKLDPMSVAADFVMSVSKTSGDDDDVYTSIKDANTESEALLREQNSLLKQLLEKPQTTEAYISTREVMSSMNRVNRRAGKTVVAMDY